MKSFLLLLALLAQPGSAPEAGDDSAPAGMALHCLVSLDAAALLLLPPTRQEGAEGLLRLAPSLILEGGDIFGLHLVAPVLLRAGVYAPSHQGRGTVRAEDWDSPSDFGQLVHALTLEADGLPFQFQAGALEDYALRSGHLVRRYSNRLHPDYHPAGAFLVASMGPLQAELFTSDVLAARLVGAEVGVSALAGRAGLSLSVAHDFGASEVRSPPVTLVHADASVALLMREGLEVHVLGGAGVRLRAPGLAWGALAGLAVESLSDTLELGGRLEARVRRGGFRQGFFGPEYELSRLQAAGASLVPLAQAPLPEGSSVFGELVVGWDGLHLDHAQRQLQLSVAAEVSGSGRVDADARVTGWLARRRVGVALAALAVGVGQPGARGAFSGEVRWYLGMRWYALAQGGTRFFPAGGAVWRPGAFLALGLGAEYAR